MKLPAIDLVWIIPATLAVGYALGCYVEDRHQRALRAHERATWDAAIAAKRKRDNDRRRQRRVDKAKDHLRG